MNPMFRTLKIPAFRNLWLGGWISTLGDMALLIALPFHVYNLTGSTLATGGTFMVQVLPRLVLGSVAGVFVDRWDRKRAMIFIDLARAAILLPLFLAQSAEWVWVVYAVAIGESTLSQFFGPAHAALLPRIVDSEELVAANSLNSLGLSTVRLVAPTLGGALLAFSGLPLVVLLDATTYVASALLIATISLRPDQRRAEEMKAPLGETFLRGLSRQWLEGIRLLQHHPLLSRLVLISAVAMLGQGVINVLLVPFVKEVLGGSALEFGWIATAQGIGGLLGGLVMGHLGIRGANIGLVSGALGVVGVTFLLMVNFPDLTAALVLMALVGGPATVYTIAVQTLLQIHSEDAYRGRLFGIYGSVIILALLVGMGTASLLGETVPLLTNLNAAGVIFLVASIIGWWIRVPPKDESA